MAARKKSKVAEREPERLQNLEAPDAIAGVPGPGRWLVAGYEVAGLFSLKSSTATSSVGKTLLAPTPYAIKMALVDAGFRAGLTDEECAELLAGLVGVEVHIAPTPGAVVTHTFVKVRQEPKQSDPSNPYVSSIAYREMAHCQGEWRWAFDLAAMTTQGVEWVVRCLAHVNYVGKRGSFIQFRSVTRTAEMSEEFTQAANAPSLLLPGRSHIAPLDDFGPEASMEILNSFAKTSPKLERHRKFVPTIVPLGLVNTGPGFSEYHR